MVMLYLEFHFAFWCSIQEALNPWHPWSQPHMEIIPTISIVSHSPLSRILCFSNSLHSSSYCFLLSLTLPPFSLVPSVKSKETPNTLNLSPGHCPVPWYHLSIWHKFRRQRNGNPYSYISAPTQKNPSSLKCVSSNHAVKTHCLLRKQWEGECPFCPFCRLISLSLFHIHQALWHLLYSSIALQVLVSS